MSARKKEARKAYDEALARLAEQGIIARTDFNAREGLLIVWLEGPEPEAGES